MSDSVGKSFVQPGAAWVPAAPLADTGESMTAESSFGAYVDEQRRRSLREHETASGEHCYWDQLADGPRQLGLVEPLKLWVLFDEERAVHGFDVERTDTIRTQGWDPNDGDRMPEVLVRVRSVVVYNGFVKLLLVDHFVRVLEPGDGGFAGSVWASGTHCVLTRLWKHLTGAELGWAPGADPARRLQAMCAARAEALRRGIGAADEWMKQVRLAAEQAQAEVDRDQATKALAGEPLAGEPGRVAF